MKLIFKRSIVFSLVCIFLIISSYSFAHGMSLKLEEPGVLKVEYDGGGFSPRTEITIYDEKGNELGKGLVDEEGKFHFDKNLDVYSAVANDGMGHRAEYEKGVIKKEIPKLPVVIAVFAVIGIIFAVFNKKKTKQKRV